LRGDALSGATSLTIEVCKSLWGVCNGPENKLRQDDIAELAVGLVRAQPNMGCIWSLADSLLKADPVPLEISRLCESTIAHHSSAPGKIADLVLPSIKGGAVLTSSSSSAVFNTLIKASSDSHLSVFVCESRPLREGVIMANELSNLGVEVTVIADAALAKYSAKVDVMLAGSDMVNGDGAIGKIGIAHMGLSSRASGVPLIVLSDSSKFVPAPLVDDLRKPDELLEPGITSVRVENVYFEEVSHGMISSIFTESRQMTGPEAARIASDVQLDERLSSLFSCSGSS
ncbi:MAG: hypothetical protein MUO84_06405, partial [Thermoplasmata archaeon]|nr:hypothetical protein [Thermoplasmata archaeon]